MKKRFISLFLLLFILASAVSCTKSEEPSATPTSPSEESVTSEQATREEESTSPEDITEPADEGVPKEPLVITEQTLIFAQDNKSNYVIIRPKNSTASVIKASTELQSYIKQISGVTLPIKTDDTPASEFEISVGYTNRAEDSMFDKEKLGNEGYVIHTKGKKLFIAGSGERGALYGVYGFLEEYLDCRFYTAEVEKIPTKEILGVNPIDYDEQIPVFEYRDIDFVSSRKDSFQVKLRANGVYSPGGASNGGKIEYVGGFVHTLGSFVSYDKYYESHPEYFAQKEDGTRQTGWDVQLCLTNPDVLQIVKDKVRSLLESRPDASIISVSQSDSGSNALPCMCENCKKIHEEEGSYSGSLIRFVNAVAAEFKDDYPNLKFDTLAYRYSRKVCKTPPAENVIVRLCTIECCFSHPLGTCDDVYAIAGSDNSIAEDIAAWGRICENIYVWDYATNYRESVIFFPNLNVLRANAKFFAEHNVIGVYEEANYYSETCDFPELRSYIMAKLLWNPYMSEEEYQSHINDFLRGVYGKGWKNIRKYIDLAQSLVKDHHFGIYEVFTASVFAPKRSTTKNSELLGSLTLDMIKDCQNTDWEQFFGYCRGVEENEITKKGMILFDAAIEMATPAEAERIEKTKLQVEFLYSYTLYAMYGKDTMSDNISTLLSDFFRRDEEAKAMSSSERNKLIFAVRDYVVEKYSKTYTDYSKKLYRTALKYRINKLKEGNVWINEGEIKFEKLPYAWK